LFARQHIDHSFSADPRFHHDEAGMFIGDFTNNRGFPAQWMRLHGGKDPIRVGRSS
jgi:hypothetical protein